MAWDVTLGFDHPAPVLGYEVWRVLDRLLYAVTAVQHTLALRRHFQIPMGEPELGHQLIGVLLVSKTYP